MPNWCSNELTVGGHRKTLQKFKEQTRGATDPNTPDAPPIPLSFNALCPMPEELSVEAGSHGNIGYAAFYGTPAEVEKILNYPRFKEAGIVTQAELQAALNQESPEYLKKAKQYRRNRTLHDFDNWYDWRVAYWGTKWDLGSDDCHLTEFKNNTLVYSFDTAWGPPLEWLQAVAAKFPSLCFTLSYQEGGMGFTGRLQMKGDRVLQNIEGEMWAGAAEEEYENEDDNCVQYYGFVSDPEQKELQKS